MSCLVYHIVGVLMILGGCALLVYTPWPFVFGLILILAGVLILV